MQPDIDRLLSESAWVKNLARKLLSDAHDAEEVAAEVISKALTQAPTDRGPRLRAWLATVTRRLAASRIRRDGLRRRSEESAARPEAQEVNFDSGLALHRLLVEAVDELPPQMREVILLRYFQDLPPRTIAKRLKVTPQAASKRLSRARSLLRERLDGESCPEDHATGRVLWCAALAETYGSAPALPALLIMSTQTKVALATLSVFLLALGWRTQRVLNPHPTQPPEPKPVVLVEPRAVTISEPEEDERNSRVTAPSIRNTSLDFRVRTSSLEAPNQARAYWFAPSGRAHSISLNEQGEGSLRNVPIGARVWVRADGWTTDSCVHDSEIELHEVTLQRAERLFGTIVEDGGPPLHPFSMIARWKGPEAEPRIRGGMRQVLGIGKLQTDVFVESNGSFELTNLPADQTVQITLPSSHVLDRGSEGLTLDSNAVHLSTSGSSALVLEAYRVPSVRGRLVRSDDQSGVEAVKVSLWLFDQEGNSHEVHGTSNSRGCFSLGLEVPYWSELNTEERAAICSRFDRLRCRFTPEDSTVRGDQIRRSLLPPPFPVDLGTIALEASEAQELDRILLLNHLGQPVHVGAIGTPRKPTRTAFNGIAEIPKRDMGESPLCAMALGHAPRLFDPRELSPNPDGLLTLRLERGFDLLLTVEDEDPATEYLVDLYWGDSPFLEEVGESGPSSLSLQQALLPPSRVLQEFWPRGSSTEKRVHWSRISADLPVQLSGLLPGAEINVTLRGVDGTIHDERDLKLSVKPGTTTASLTPRELREPEAGEFILVGSVRDVLDQPLADVQLLLEYNQRHFQACSSKDGSIRIGPLRLTEPRKRTTIKVKTKKAGYVSERATWDTGEAAPLPELHLVLHRERTLDLYFEDEHGEPQSVRGVEIDVGEAHFRSAHKTAPHHFRLPFAKQLRAEATVHAGLEIYRFSIPPHVTEMQFVLPNHGSLLVPNGSSSTGMNLRLHVSPLNHSERKGRSFIPGLRSGWNGSEDESVYSSMTIELLPGRYSARWNDGLPEEFEIVAGETTEFQSRP